MKKLLVSTLIVSFLFNIILVYALSLETAYFNDKHSWGLNSMTTEGIVLFNEEKNQSDTKEYVQYYSLRCLFKNCQVIEGVMSNDHIRIDEYEPEILKLSYGEKESILRHKDCVFTVTSGATTFNCTKGNATGSLGSHIKLHFKQHSFF